MKNHNTDSAMYNEFVCTSQIQQNFTYVNSYAINTELT